MNFAGFDSAGWIYQQDYLTFLATLGWLTAGLIAWGNSGAAGEPRSIPWRWFALFALFSALDGVLDLGKMMSPGSWPREFDSLFRLIGYGILLEFARRVAWRRRWAQFSWVLPVFLPTVALGLLFFHQALSPVPQIVLAVLAGTTSAVTLLATVTKGSRLLLLTGVALLLLAPLEVLRAQQGVEIDRLYGLFVTGEGFVNALGGCALAWMAGTGIWLHSVLRRWSGAVGERPEALSTLPAVVLPSVIGLILVVGFFLVNRSSDEARRTVEDGFLTRVRTAALAIDIEMLSAAGDGADSRASMRVSQQLHAIRSAGEDLRRVYLWQLRDGRAVPLPGWLVGHVAVGEEPAVVRVGGSSLPTGGPAFVAGPLGVRSSAVILASAPVVDYVNARQLAWLGVDIAADAWLRSQAAARLQTTALVGLFASVIVFFLAYQILREHESDLLVAKESAEAADRAKDEFLAVMSHEIRTPMQSVLGYGELIARTPLTPTQADYLDAIRSQGRTLLRIVQDILDFSILRKSTYTLKRETVFLHRLVESAFETIQPLAARRNLRSTLSIGASVPEVVLGDGVRIEQVLLNLLGNAVKFTDHGGVDLSVLLEGSLRQNGQMVNHLLFTVTDTGTGIRPKDVRRLFHPFTRLSEAEGTPREGAGLGLAIVKRICELMGGGIDLESEWGKGTRFLVRLPLPTADAAASEAEASPAGSGPAPEPGVERLGEVLPLRILVADDNPYIRMLLIEYLRFIGYEPTAVASGVDVARRWREFDLIIMDLRMPGMDGVTAAGRIRAESGDVSVPWIVGVSATLAEAEITRAMEAGMNDFLGKPFFVQSLVEAIQASPLFARRKAAPDAADKDEVDEPGDEPPPPPEPKPLPVSMSWMPDLAADGSNEIVQQAMAEIPGLFAEIEAGLQSGDHENAADRAHYLKNTILALRIDPMTVPCRTVYERAMARDQAGALAALATLKDAFARWESARAQPPGAAG